MGERGFAGPPVDVDSHRSPEQLGREKGKPETGATALSSSSSGYSFNQSQSYIDTEGKLLAMYRKSVSWA